MLNKMYKKIPRKKVTSLYPCISCGLNTPYLCKLCDSPYCKDCYVTINLHACRIDLSKTERKRLRDSTRFGFSHRGGY